MVTSFGHFANFGQVLILASQIFFPTIILPIFFITAFLSYVVVEWWVVFVVELRFVKWPVTGGDRLLDERANY
jgi:hypothetical protein